MKSYFSIFYFCLMIFIHNKIETTSSVVGLYCIINVCDQIEWRKYCSYIGTADLLFVVWLVSKIPSIFS